MAVTVTLVCNAAIALDKVYELRLNGLVQGTHFDFVFHPGKTQWLDTGTPSSVEFTFYDSKLATFYSLKWQ